MIYEVAIVASIVFLLPTLLYLMGTIRDPFHPLIYVGSLGFLISTAGILAYKNRVLALISESMITTYLWVSILSMLGFYAGWLLHWRRQRRRPETASLMVETHYDPSKLFFWAVIFDLVGVATYFFTRNDFTVTGYLREFGTLWIIGAILSVQVFLVAPTSFAACCVILGISLIPPIDRFIVYGQRGDTFRIFIILLPFFFYRKITPPRAIFIPAAITIALVLGTLDRTRTIMGRGEANTRIEALVKVIPSLFETNDTVKATGAETYVFGPAMVQTVRDQQSYEYGAFLYNIGVRFLPKEFFDKDPLYTRWNATTFGTITSETQGFSVPGGSAPTGFANAFVEFGWGAPIFWGLLGYWWRRRYVRAETSSDLREHAFLTASYIIGLYLISQDLYAATMNSIYLFPAMAIAYRTSRVRSTEHHAELTPAMGGPL